MIVLNMEYNCHYVKSIIKMRFAILKSNCAIKKTDANNDVRFYLITLNKSYIDLKSNYMQLDKVHK